jgi:hypothetical protein
MTRFDEEWALVPAGARWVAALVFLAMGGLMASLFLLPLLVQHEYKGLLFVFPIFLLSLIGAVMLAIYVLLVGYVYGDARRRGMNQVMWTLLAIFIPSAVGVILYFILRDPIPVPCPSCETPARKGYAFCASCGAAVRSACSQCRQPVEAGWRNCVRCGAALPQGPVAAPAPEART